MAINSTDIAAIVKKVIAEMDVGTTQDAGIPVGISNRHIHLCKQDLETLFGAGYELTPMKDLSQPGQYACKALLLFLSANTFIGITT